MSAGSLSLVEKSELTAKPGTEDAFLAELVEKGQPLLRGVDGVVSVRIGKGIEDPGKFVLLVEWTSLDAHKAYGSTQTALDFRALVGPFVAGGAMEHFEFQ